MFKLVQTCGACPEQYDVHLNYDEETGSTEDGDGNTCIGYMRLRHGYFYAEYRGVVVYSANTKGDGCFEWDERECHLNRACLSIKDAIDRDNGEEPDLIYEVVEKYYGDF